MQTKPRKIRSAIAVVMRDRYAHTGTILRDRRDRRPNDARRSWKREVWS